MNVKQRVLLVDDEIDVQRQEFIEMFNREQPLDRNYRSSMEVDAGSAGNSAGGSGDRRESSPRGGEAAVPDRILLVDDEELVVLTLERMLRGHFNLETAIGPEAGMDAIAFRGPYAVVLSDMRMPGMTGVELLTQVKLLNPATIRLVLTGNAFDDRVKAAVRSGVVDGIVEKPCGTGELIETLKQAMTKRRPVPLVRFPCPAASLQ
jgi:CheY-like chemotaxis protein